MFRLQAWTLGGYCGQAVWVEEPDANLANSGSCSLPLGMKNTTHSGNRFHKQLKKRTAAGVASLLLLLPSEVSRAGGVVTNCTESNLRAAMQGGGTVTFACDGTITLASTITNTADTLLNGSGHSVTISGPQAFYVSSNTAFSLRSVNLAYCSAISNGGAIFNNGGTVNLQNCVFNNNQAVGSYGYPATAYGGAIYNAGNLVADSCAFLSNSAQGGHGLGAPAHGGIAGSPGGAAYGGAIYSLGTMAVSRSLFAGNSVSGGNGGNGSSGTGNPPVGGIGGRGGDGGIGRGGALDNEGTGEAVNCTFTGNTASAGNGGVGGHGGDVFNGVGGPGGAGGNAGSAFGAISGAFNLVNCSIAFNSATAGSAGSGGSGGYGTYGSGAPGPSGASGSAVGGGVSGGTMVNSLLAANSPGNCSGCSDGGHNLSSDASCAFTSVGSMNNTDPKLGPLANNGGPTLTMALLPGSPAIDAGDTSLAPATDQRGFPRPAGLAADLGAYEYGSVMPQLSISRSGTNGLNLLGSGNGGQSCRLLSSLDLSNWIPIATNLIGSDGTVLFYDTCAPAGACRFYRLVMP